MAQRVSGKVKVGTSYVDVLFPSHIKAVVGLLSGEKINRSILPKADASNQGVVKLSSSYDATTPDAETALSQAGAKALYELIRNLESPLDYLAANVISLSGTISSADKTRVRNELNTFLDAWFDAEFSSITLRPGHAILLTNSQTAYLETSAGVDANIKGTWLYIYDGTKWNPAINFPEIARADYNGTTEAAMVEGLITKAMLWKLKGIEVGAQKNTITGVKGDSESTYRTGNVNITKGNIGLGNVENKSSEQIRAEITGFNIVNALGYTPYDQSNPFNFINASQAPVQGVKGNNEGSYRTGNVNITKDNIGLGNVPNIDATNASNISSGTLPSARLPAATVSARGGVILASQADAIAGTPSTSLVITPATGKALVEHFAITKIYESLPAIGTLPEGKVILVLEEII